ncbi:histidinol-phosphate transaminase [Thermoclostridium stercorarium subsp. thermolacticum DSM 2910]|uniref:Histidinol-phosphate aminotransferase n=1 Tax=Thermoclostridium stercorarium subsp. thermolacticum DSM 2910 TaxID=1121336 RepID=A0A1B1YAK8_THEST|nr:histidinol-phosphate transaminase [Thermoclostridium stercorarium]ANW97801.1 histidinol-phosphate transaminase [Thermoclostridium stercorarium subsp. thermolacticum DSM 2910]
MSLPFRDVLKDIAPYVPGKPISDVQRELGLTEVVKLASNENPYGFSPKVDKALKEAFSDIPLYPDGNATVLREKLAEKYGLKPEQFVFGAGSNEIITLIAQIFLNPGDESIFASPSFVWYDTAVKVSGGKSVIIPLKDYTHDLEAIKNAITDKTRIIWICNPNNPTGTIVTAQQLNDFLEAVPENVVVVLDEAYYEYARGEDYPETVPLLEKYPNLIILRTFSKAYGLASLRVGYGIASAEIVSFLNRIRPPFNVNTLAQVAAVAALDDEDFVRNTVNETKKGLEFLYNAFDRLNLRYVKSRANFVWVETKLPSQELFKKLLNKGVIIRPFMDNWVRITVGTHEQNRKLISAMEEVL